MERKDDIEQRDRTEFLVSEQVSCSTYISEGDFILVGFLSYTV
jgi:hypothetical protein